VPSSFAPRRTEGDRRSSHASACTPTIRRERRKSRVGVPTATLTLDLETSQRLQDLRICIGERVSLGSTGGIEPGTAPWIRVSIRRLQSLIWLPARALSGLTGWAGAGAGCLSSGSPCVAQASCTPRWWPLPRPGCSQRVAPAEGEAEARVMASRTRKDSEEDSGGLVFSGTGRRPPFRGNPAAAPHCSEEKRGDASTGKRLSQYRPTNMISC
jgi:hypothetical protein